MAIRKAGAQARPASSGRIRQSGADGAQRTLGQRILEQYQTSAHAQGAVQSLVDDPNTPEPLRRFLEQVQAGG